MIDNNKRLPEKTDIFVPPRPAPTKIRTFIHMDLDIFYRRKRLLLLYHAGKVNKLSLRALADQLTERYQRNGINKTVKVATLRKDLQCRAKWERFIWAREEAHEEGKEQLKFLQLAREKAIYLMYNADNDCAKVGAIGKLVAVVTADIKLRQSLGILPNVENSMSRVDPKSQQENVIVDEALLRRYSEIIDRERKVGSNKDNNSEQQGDSKSSNA